MKKYKINEIEKYLLPPEFQKIGKNILFNGKNLNIINFERNENFEVPYRLITKQSLKHPCGLGRNIFHILADGDIFPCQLIAGMDEFKICNIENFTINHMEQNNYLNRIEKDKNKCKNCWIKTLCKYCPARTYLETNDFLLSDNKCLYKKMRIEELIVYIVTIYENKKKYKQLIQKVQDYRRKNEDI